MIKFSKWIKKQEKIKNRLLGIRAVKIAHCNISKIWIYSQHYINIKIQNYFIFLTIKLSYAWQRELSCCRVKFDIRLIVSWGMYRYISWKTSWFSLDLKYLNLLLILTVEDVKAEICTTFFFVIDFRI